MTPELRAAIGRLRKWTDFLSDQLPDGTPQLAEVPVADLRVVLTAALAPEAERLLGPRHQPLTDETCGVIPTPRGTQLVNDYRAHRTQQHPRTATDA